MELIELIEKFGAPLVTGIGGYLVGRPKQQAEVESANVENAAKVIDKWEGYSNRLEKNIDLLRSVIDELSDALVQVKDEKLGCNKALSKLQVEYDEIMKLYLDLQKELKNV